MSHAVLDCLRIIGHILKKKKLIIGHILKFNLFSAPPLITMSKETATIVARVNESVKLDCSASGANPPPSRTWYQENRRMKIAIQESMIENVKILAFK